MAAVDRFHLVMTACLHTDTLNQRRIGPCVPMAPCVASVGGALLESQSPAPDTSADGPPTSADCSVDVIPLTKPETVGEN